jgi:two-component system nitrogen regulation sensor histidine kinase NtrY
VGRVAALLAGEIDAPLSAIEASLRQLRQAAGTSDRVDRATERIADQIDQLNRSIRDLRRIAQPRAMSLSRVALIPSLRQAASPIAERPDLDGVEIVIGGEPLVVSGDARLLHDAFQNLLLNAGEAVRAAADSGTVRVNVSRLGEDCLVEFSDSGPGIDPDDRGNVFRPFFTTREDHAGLGLAIVRRAVEAHGGEVEIGGSDLGGARVRVTLPLD